MPININIMQFKRFQHQGFTLCPFEIPQKTNTDIIFHKDANTLAGYRDLLSNSDNISTIFEIGVKNGGSLALWHLATSAKVFGIDINTKQVTDSVRKFAQKHPISWAEMNSTNHVAVKQMIINKLGISVDMIIDDAAHTIENITDNFNNYWSIVTPGGLYVIEDWLALHPEHQRQIIEIGRTKIAQNAMTKDLGEVDWIYLYRNFIAFRKTF